MRPGFLVIVNQEGSELSQAGGAPASYFSKQCCDLVTSLGSKDGAADHHQLPKTEMAIYPSPREGRGQGRRREGRAGEMPGDLVLSLAATTLWKSIPHLPPIFLPVFTATGGKGAPAWLHQDPRWGRQIEGAHSPCSMPAPACRGPSN